MARVERQRLVVVGGVQPRPTPIDVREDETEHLTATLFTEAGSTALGSSRGRRGRRARDRRETAGAGEPPRRVPVAADARGARRLSSRIRPAAARTAGDPLALDVAASAVAVEAVELGDQAGGEGLRGAVHRRRQPGRRRARPDAHLRRLRGEGRHRPPRDEPLGTSNAERAGRPARRNVTRPKRTFSIAAAWHAAYADKSVLGRCAGAEEMVGPTVRRRGWTAADGRFVPPGMEPGAKDRGRASGAAIRNRIKPRRDRGGRRGNPRGNPRAWPSSRGCRPARGSPSRTGDSSRRAGPSPRPGARCAFTGRPGGPGPPGHRRRPARRRGGTAGPLPNRPARGRRRQSSTAGRGARSPRGPLDGCAC